MSYMPLDDACREGQVEVVLALIDQGADVNAPINGGWTPLHLALGNGHTVVAVAVIDKGADVNARNNNGDNMGNEEV